jgi:hypothetical protein
MSHGAKERQLATCTMPTVPVSGKLPSAKGQTLAIRGGPDSKPLFPREMCVSFALFIFWYFFLVFEILLMIFFRIIFAR